MDFYNMIDSLNSALKKEKLIIFVGAGISKNSGIPTWGQMVRVFAEKLGYPEHKLTTDEYIRIPQYFYGIDESNNHEEYYRILEETIDLKVKPNILNELIVKINPKHIVTTNYDNLMDQVAKDYEIVNSDKDLLEVSKSNYLIKMHGDIKDVKKIVFKEDDYLQYSETHRLMETFLKSLLIDHVFLFVGYSLNDYNLNTFTSWIDFIAKEMNVKESMHKNFFLSSSMQAGKGYLRKYYEDKGLYVIDMYDIPRELEEKVDTINLDDEMGRRTYVILDMLYKKRKK